MYLIKTCILRIHVNMITSLMDTKLKCIYYTERLKSDFPLYQM